MTCSQSVVNSDSVVRVCKVCSKVAARSFVGRCREASESQKAQSRVRSSLRGVRSATVQVLPFAGSKGSGFASLWVA